MVRKKRPAETTQSTLFSDMKYDPRFLETLVGSRILHDPKTAIVELIANSWDAGATEVLISWPDSNGAKNFSISDNGTGMTSNEFLDRWQTWCYDRQKEQGAIVRFPPKIAGAVSKRHAFGRNGIGRWAGFCFGEEYLVDTCKDGKRNCYLVQRKDETPLLIEPKREGLDCDKHGTRISCSSPRSLKLLPEDARAEIGMRFLTDPSFHVFLNGEKVDFEHIEDQKIQQVQVRVDDDRMVDLIIIDTRNTDRTTRQHGVAWHVGGRLVGECSWKGFGAYEDLIDGRRIAAKRCTFIVKADILVDIVKRDWTGFETEDSKDDLYRKAANAVYEVVRQYLFQYSEEDRKETLAKARGRNLETLKTMGPLEREKWTEFVTKAQENCPSIKETDIVKLSEVVANLEQAKSGYALLHKISEYGPDQLDDLHRLLENWTLDMAKAVLDEIGRRLKQVEELRARMDNENTQEVQDLQPLFEQGLWIFGPEFETIEYTSNEGMTRVVQDLFKLDGATGSRNRPDFAILPDGTSGLYSYPCYDDAGSEIGTERLVVVELKKPGVKIGEKEKAQCWKYVKELYEKGLLRDGISRVKCFVLGSKIDPSENFADKKKSDYVVIQPLLFATVLQRAKSRLLKLHERVKNAPFLKNHREKLEAFLAPIETKSGLFEEANT